MTDPTTEQTATEQPKTAEQRHAEAIKNKPFPAEGGEFVRRADGTLERTDKPLEPPRWKSEPTPEAKAAEQPTPAAAPTESAEAQATGDAARGARRSRLPDAAAE